MSSLAIDDLNIEPFKNFNIFFPHQSFTMIVASSGSGKTRLLKVLSGWIRTEEKVRINRTYIEKIPFYKLQKKIAFFPAEFNSLFIYQTIEETLKSSLEYFLYDKKTENKIIKDIAMIFGLSKWLKKSPQDLTYNNQAKLFLAKLLLEKPDILLLDEPLKKMTQEEKKDFLDLLEHYHHEQNLTIIMTTTSLEETIMIPISKLYILEKGQKVLSGKPLEVLKEDSMLSKLGLKIPFLIDLCVKLQYYNLLEEIILKEESLVDELWK